MSLSIKKGDMVEIRSGKHRGKTGKILKVLCEENSVLIEKLNLVKRHSRPTKSLPQGGIVEKEGSIHYSNVLLLCPKCKRGVRTTSKILGDGSKVRVCRKCKELIDKG
ncbi:MAG: 50S ribosomal protein L24 [Deltaproteobacteria bacterium RIFCSPHIGHO2_12_FULL_43_9]|nr:MAG: 50S ribosomal protein L24 [Deltaproteobacteria bacterium RIFCSPHIGHO2_12_FULL_43_9]